MINKKQLIYKQLNYWDKKIRQLENNVGWETRSHMQSVDQLKPYSNFMNMYTRNIHELLYIFLNTIRIPEYSTVFRNTKHIHEYNTYSWILYIIMNTKHIHEYYT